MGTATIHISNKCPGEVDAADPTTSLWEPLVQEAVLKSGCTLESPGQLFKKMQMEVSPLNIDLIEQE